MSFPLYAVSGKIPTRIMSKNDYKDLKHFLEIVHENEKWYQAGTGKLIPEDSSVDLFPVSKISDVFSETKVKLRTYEIVKELNTPGTFSVYSKRHNQMRLQSYFSKFDKSNGTTAREVYENVWESILSTKEEVVYEYGYASDNYDSFSDQIKTLNLQKLVDDSLLGLFDEETKRIEGIFSVYAYYGVTGSIGAIHIEDSDLMSLNMNIWGAPKHWLSTGEENREKVIKVMAESDSTFNDHPHHYRCKMMVISPNTLHENRIPLYETFQHKNELIVTLCGGFHQIVNCGMFFKFS